MITPRWLFVLAAATPESFGDPILVDESIEQLDPETIRAGDVVGISVHTGNALRGYQVGKLAKDRGATVVMAGFMRRFFPEEPFERDFANHVVKGDGDVAWVLFFATLGQEARSWSTRAARSKATNSSPPAGI